MTGAQLGNYTSVFGSILDSIGAVYSGYLNNSVAKANAKVAQAQADLIDSNTRARTLLSDTNIKLRTDRAKKEMRYFSGTQAAAYASSGVRLTGSPIDVMVNSQANQELDLALTNINDRISVSQANMQDILNASTYRSQAMLDKAAGSQAIAAGYGNATKSLLSAAVNYKAPSKTKIGG